MPIFSVYVFIFDRVMGKPKQDLSVSGGIVHAHTVYRNPQLAALSLDELQALDGITKKLALHAPDGPHNQTQSEPATNAIDVEREDVQASQVPENAPNSES